MTERAATPASSAPHYVCRCEEVAADEIRQAIADGAHGVNDVKRRTRAGMGLCQGIFCVRPIADLLQQATGIAAEDIAPMTARPPVRLVPLALLAEPEQPKAG